jgi:hypothetical protein
LSFHNPQTCRIPRIITELHREATDTEEADGEEYPQHPK